MVSTLTPSLSSLSCSRALDLLSAAADFIRLPPSNRLGQEVVNLHCQQQPRHSRTAPAFPSKNEDVCSRVAGRRRHNTSTVDGIRGHRVCSSVTATAPTPVVGGGTSTNAFNPVVGTIRNGRGTGGPVPGTDHDGSGW